MTTFTPSQIEIIPEIPKRGMPVTLITGFLGSGKTTLLNQILKNKENLKVAVLVNEFGDINIDSQLLVSVDQDMMELSNGCICCTINDGLVDAVYRILEREDRIDYLVIETTGVADPLPIILTFLGTELRDLTNIDSIITLVDVEAFDAEHFQSESALKQITYGDIILLNKVDLATPEKIKEVESYIHEVKVGAKILHTQYGEVPLPLILDTQLTPQQEYISIAEADAHKNHEDHHHDHEHHHHEHHNHEHHHHHSDHLDNDGFISISFQSDRPFDVHKFEAFLTEEMPAGVFRAKGILWFNDSDLRHIFQLSGPRYNLHADDWCSQPKNQLVFIGRNLKPSEIHSHLHKCLV
ncbi:MULTISPECIES: CobW family GTP-binding protein [Cyanophyceae]|uniref:Cobalamin biosynthesis protein CobW n=1 Tax=Nodularia spumigena CENA596 TaxID=1819295 RepID=A0A166K304_NODSP|nr:MULTISPECIES: GTP-binding protein [Cyanophyceae]MDB9357680.1 GTP-binding protein [Nodularia spumigena CS-587/03]KZL50508.1 cobalamin biosynthesis protein CobW [Nodularia spumigena CENA596]MDB9306977.1 GTP-binding protein [Nodularia spumigena CS-591/12]MDB9317947.1 GTP-binding protein [Nodularia spumigena CS-590/01A]MDB9324339.1 GTP-binding protein [Nodularia spumigena CS-591/07A]